MTFICSYENLLTQDAIEFCSLLCEEAHHRALISSYNVEKANYRNTFTNRDIRDTEDFKKLQDTLFKFFFIKTEEYVKANNINLVSADEAIVPDGYCIEAMNFLKYKPGCFYKTHSDEPLFGFSTTYSTRRLSYVLFVNDDFSGGSLHFPNHKTTITPKKNTLIIFPSDWTYLHQVKPVLRGTRKTVVTWGGWCFN